MKKKTRKIMTRKGVAEARKKNKESRKKYFPVSPFKNKKIVVSMFVIILKILTPVLPAPHHSEQG